MLEEMKVLQSSFRFYWNFWTDSQLTKIFKKAEQQFSEFRSNLESSSEVLDTNEINDKYEIMGDSVFSPALNCNKIKLSNLNKRSGFYWVKNECMEKPLRVFCDFNNFDKFSLDYYIYDMKEPEIQKRFLLNGITPTQKEQVISTIREKCGELGLEPLEIKNKEVLNRLLYLIDMYKFIYGKDYEYVFPIGIDYRKDLNVIDDESSSNRDINTQYFSFNKNEGPDILMLMKINLMRSLNCI